MYSLLHNNKVIFVFEKLEESAFEKENLVTLLV